MFPKTILLQILLFSAVPQPAIPHGVVTISARSAGAPVVGTGMCLDTPCRHVLTNYHVAALLGRHPKVEGVPVQVTQMYTGPNDSGAKEIQTAIGVLKYNPAKDLALMTLAAALPARFPGLSFAADAPRIGQDVLRTARFEGQYDLTRGRVVSDEVTHRSVNGTLTLLPRHFLLDCPSRPGNSGGVILDEAGKVLGMITMRSTDGDGKVGTIAISSVAVSEFLKGANQVLWSKLFSARLTATPLDAEAWPAGLGPLATPGQQAPGVAGMLRSKARENAAAMQNIVAVESVSTWGQNESRRSWLFRIAMYSDGQKYQRITAKEGFAKQPVTSEILWPRMTGVVPGEQWSMTPALMNDAALEHKGTSTYEGKIVNVFHYTSSAAGCISRSLGKKIYAGCSGWVVADTAMNALIITQRMDLPAGDASVIRWTEKYRWMPLSGLEVLLPSELEMSGEFRTGKTYFASASWSRYQLFVAESTLRFDQPVE